MLTRRLRRSLVVIGLSLFVATSGCGQTQPGQMRVQGSEKKLAALLRARGVTVGRGRHASAASVRSAWGAFKAFAALRVDNRDLDSTLPNDDLLFELGVFDFGPPWRRTFEISFVRQYATKDGDLQQVNLVIHFAPSAAALIAARIGHQPEDPVLWASMLGGSSRDDQRERWVHQIEASPAFRAVLAQRLRPLGYELWQESAE